MPSIYGLDFAASLPPTSRNPQQLEAAGAAATEPAPEPDNRQGFVFKWQLCGRGEVKGQRGGGGIAGARLEAAALVVLPSAAAAAGEGKGKDGPLRVAVLVGCAGRGVGAWELVLLPPSGGAEAGGKGRLEARPLVEWEGGWAVGALDWVEAYAVGPRAVVVVGADGAGKLWRWVVMGEEGEEGGPWRVGGGRLEGGAAALPAGAAAHLRGLRGAPGAS